jgi:hypothetical protein
MKLGRFDPEMIAVVDVPSYCRFAYPMGDG